VSNFGRNLALWVIVALLLVALFNVFQPSGSSGRASMQVAYSDFLNEVNAGQVRDVVIQGRTVSGSSPTGAPSAPTRPRIPRWCRA
jgi:cell division protease FtsH